MSINKKLNFQLSIKISQHPGSHSIWPETKFREKKDNLKNNN